MIVLGQCSQCTPCGSGATCDTIAFLLDAAHRDAIGTNHPFLGNEGTSITFTVARLPQCFSYHGTPADFETAAGYPPPVYDGQYFYDTTGAGQFWLNTAGVYSTAPAPAFYGNGSITVEWEVTTTECGCPHMIANATGSLSWGAGDVSNKSFTVPVTCPGPPTYWACEGVLAGGETATVVLTQTGGTGCAFTGENALALGVCTHGWPNGSVVGAWAARTYSHFGTCAKPSVGLGFHGEGNYQNLVQRIVLASGAEYLRTETDFDPSCLYLVEKRERYGALGENFFDAPPGYVVIEDTDSKSHKLYPVDGTEFIQEYTNPVTPPQDVARDNRIAAQAASPDDEYGIETVVYSDTPEYATAPDGSWDAVTSITGWGSAGGPPPYEASGSGGPRTYDVIDSTFGGVTVSSPAVDSVLNLDYRGCYAGNPYPQRFGIVVKQYTYNRADGTHSLASTSSCTEITDTKHTIEANGPEGYAEYTSCAVPVPSGCPSIPDFVCHPGLPACP